MTKTETGQLLVFIAKRWPWREIPAETAGAWAEDLADIDFSAAMVAAKEHAAEEEFPPSIAAIRRRCGRVAMTDEDRVARAYHRRMALSTIEVFGIERGRIMIGEARMLELFPDHEPTERTALEDAIARELAPARPELEAAE